MPAPSPAICQEVVWKNGELRRFCVALVRAALEGPAEFTTDIVPDSARAIGDDVPGTGMAGSAVTLLKNANVIKPVGVFQNGKFYSHRVKSERPNAKDRWLNVYQLTSVPLAKEFLARNGGARNVTQPEMFPQPTNLAGIAA